MEVRGASPLFPYLHDLRYSCDSMQPEPCVICGQVGRAYWLLGDDDIGHEDLFVCESCLASGRLAEKDLSVNQADMATLLQQLRLLKPALTEAECQRLVQERTFQVECCTPRPSVLNRFLWPAHCGDYAVFYRQVYAEDLNQIAPDGDGKAFFAAHLPSNYLHDHGTELIDREWERDLNGFWRFYLWRCRICEGYLLTCDCD